MNYLEAVQDMRRHLVKAYNMAGGLRDAANQEEKEYYNAIRGNISKMETMIERLEHLIIETHRHNMVL